MKKDNTFCENKQDVKSYAEKYVLRGWNVVTVPYGMKNPTKKWAEHENRKQTIAYLETSDWNWDKTNIAIVCGKISNLVVIDCDNQETAEWYKKQFPNYINTYKVKTRRGIHYYYSVPFDEKDEKDEKSDSDDDIKIETKQLKFELNGILIKLDIRSDKALIMAPPSVYIWQDEETKEQKSSQYTALNDIESIMTVDLKAFKKDVIDVLLSLQQAYERKKQEEKEDREEGIDTETIETKGISKYRIKEDALINFLKNIYTEGQRNLVIMYASGFLRKAGYSLDEAEEFFRKFFETVDDEEEKARFLTIRHTYKREDINQLKGYSGLVELCSEDEKLKRDLKGCFYKKREWGDWLGIHVKDWTVYVREIDDEGNTRLVEVGPAFRVAKRLIENDTVKYVIETQFTQAVTTTEDIIKTATNASGKLILKPTKWKEFVNKTFSEHYYRFPTVLSMMQTGWQRKRLILGGKERKLFFFAHPAVRYDDVEFEMADGHLLANHTEIRTDTEYERFVVNALSDGKLLGLLYLFSFSSVLIELMKESAFTVILSGESGAGKTTLASLACSLFYPAHEELITANTTHVGIELAMKGLKNLPILLDEGALRKVNLQDIVFMVAQGKGKLRGTKHLGINLSSFSSVMFYTSEASELSELTRGGAFRRIVYIPIRRNDSNISEIYSMDELVNMRKYWGLGLDYIKRIQYEYENQTDLWKEAMQYGEEKATQYQGFSWLKVVYATLYMLEKILEIKLTKDEGFWTLESMLEDVMNQSLKRFNEESNTTQKFIKLLSSFIIQNMSKLTIVTPQGAQHPKSEIVGYRAINEIGILTSVFEKFCDETGFNIDIILNEMEKMKVLKRPPDRRTTRKMIDGVKGVYYVFLADALGIALDGNEGTEEEDRVIEANF